MSDQNVLAFLRHVAGHADLLDTLKTHARDEVIAIAADLGYPFTKAEFDAVVWDAEVGLAGARGQSFDGHFPLWHVMWGQHYLEYLVTDLITSMDETGTSR
jgi:hypothetical protein